ncbi:hypothetical protein A5N15_01195 [Rothia kristinae]|uniref:Uncharacterized protein n=1 Tax=Rothia kristinae TaxID=37923 RepID=A0A657IVZ6_9MICC|nr:hypothetical protein A5N15_01195 [Rothia kristinae]
MGLYVRVHQWDPPAEQSLGRSTGCSSRMRPRPFGAVVLREDVLEAEREGRKAPIAAFAISYRSLDADAPGREVSDDEATEVLLGYDPDRTGVGRTSCS